MTTVPRPLVVGVQLVLALVLLGMLAAQVSLPGLARDLGGGYAETRDLVAPYAAAGIVAIGAVQLALLTVWWLARRTLRGPLEAVTARRAVLVLAGCVLVATGAPLVVLTHLLVVVHAGGPAVLLAWLACAVTGPAVLVALRRHQRATAA